MPDTNLMIKVAVARPCHMASICLACFCSLFHHIEVDNARTPCKFEPSRKTAIQSSCGNRAPFQHGTYLHQQHLMSGPILLAKTKPQILNQPYVINTANVVTNASQSLQIFCNVVQIADASHLCALCRHWMSLQPQASRRGQPARRSMALFSPLAARRASES